MFLQLPFRVVVSKILPFCLVSLERRKLYEEFHLYGRFREDKQRKAFFLFHSLEIKNCINETSKILLNYPKIRNLRIHNPNQKLFDSIVSISHQFKSLTKLELSHEVEEDDCDEDYFRTSYRDLLSKKKCFPALKNLIFSINTYQETRFPIDSKDYYLAKDVWENLDSLTIKIPDLSNRDRKENHIDRIFSSGYLKNLQKLLIDRLWNQNEGNPLIIDAPKLNELKIDGTWGGSNLRFKSPMQKLKKATLVGLEKEVFDTMIFSPENKNFKELYFGHMDEGKLDWLFSHELFTQLKKLTIMGGDFKSNENNNNNNQIYEFGECLEDLVISGMRKSSNFNEQILTNEKLNIKDLKIHSSPAFLGNLKYPGLEKRLIKLEIVIMPNFSELLFQNNHFESLQELRISAAGHLTGIRWKRFENLRILELRATNFCNDQNKDDFKYFFEIEDEEKLLFPRLESLKIDSWDPDSENYMNWNPKLCRNLKYLEFSYCDSLIDEFFSTTNKFQGLRELKIMYCELIRGRNWGIFGQEFKKLLVEGCESFDLDGFEKKKPFVEVSVVDYKIDFDEVLSEGESDYEEGEGEDDMEEL